ncbi:MAG: tRNA glutamyl-Q(34) synthetase GluQRS, partial [Mariprofundaceae bacterium]|nr:tRNA glutamyl-Q(34) synthetase GluQRS [Mariprofundaceae bacterium]
MSKSIKRTRFAPSPTGLMHVGNAFSALQCQQWSEKNNADFILRIEDIDFTRCRPEYTQSIIEDLKWLGIHWHGEIRQQSEHLQCYQEALVQLQERGLIYPCFCTRKHIQQEMKFISLAPHAEDMHDPYPGICRNIPTTEQQKRMQSEVFAWRLNVSKASKTLHKPIYWLDEQGIKHHVQPEILGDMVIARKDIGISYHLAVVIDDALQGITQVIRGKDLRSSTAIHSLLQALLKLPSPIYQHHDLILDAQGKRLAKRNQSTTLKSLREASISPQTLRNF